MTIIILSLLLMVLQFSCFEEPVWCDATLFLTIKNNTSDTVLSRYDLNQATYIWKDSLTMIEASGGKKEEIRLNKRIFKVEPKISYSDTIHYRYYQEDGPCARASGTSKYLKMFLIIAYPSNTNLTFNIYPWDTNISFEYIEEGFENINYDTIIVE